MRVSMETAESKRVILCVIGGALFGAASGYSASICMFNLPACPGAFIATLLGAEEVMSDHGAELEWLLPTNLAFYALAGLALGIYINRRKRLARDGPRCTECGYSLVGNVSGRCPECGTAISKDLRK
jgi:hypothetical protein